MKLETLNRIKKDAKLMNGNIGAKSCNLLLNTIDCLITELEMRSQLPAVVYTDEADYAIDLAKAELAKELLDMINSKLHK